MRSTEDELKRLQQHVQAEAVKSREIPGYAPLRVRVWIDVGEVQVAKILQSVVSPEVAATLDDAAIVQFVTDHYQAETDRPIEVDFGPYLDRVRAMRSDPGWTDDPTPR